MTRALQLVLWLALLALVLMAAGCQEGGIGIGVPAPGARWGSSTAGPDVLVAGGPVYR